MKKLTTCEFIENAILRHNGRYDYSKSSYISTDTKICVICPVHGEFWQTPHDHLAGSGCPECGRESSKALRKTGLADFIEKAEKLHGRKYDYSHVTEYTNNRDKVEIICKACGESFFQSPDVHLRGCGCPKCARNQKLGKDEFVKRAERLFPEYDFSEVEYVNSQMKVCVVCPRHGKWRIKPNDILNGHRCPKCSGSKGERAILEWLRENGFAEGEDFKCQKKFEACRDKQMLPYDFYFPGKNLLIEYDGIQHFQPVKYFGGAAGFERTKRHDKIKEEYAKSSGILLEHITYKDDVLQKLEKLLK